MVAGGIPGDIIAAIDNGDVWISLCRPLDLYMHWYTNILSRRLGGNWWKALIVLAVALCLPTAYRIGLPDSALGFALFALSAIAAALLSVVYEMLIVTVRMDVSWGSGPMYLLQMMAYALSGGYLPLQLWPNFMQGFLAIQPFAGTMDSPLRLYIGTIPPAQALAAITLQIGWICVFVWAGRILLCRKLKNVIVQGG